MFVILSNLIAIHRSLMGVYHEPKIVINIILVLKGKKVKPKDKHT